MVIKTFEKFESTALSISVSKIFAKILNFQKFQNFLSSQIFYQPSLFTFSTTKTTSKRQPVKIRLLQKMIIKRNLTFLRGCIPIGAFSQGSLIMFYWRIATSNATLFLNQFAEPVLR